MQLAIDIGNTNLKFGVFENQELLEIDTGREALFAVLDKYPKIRKAVVSRTGADEDIDSVMIQRNIRTLYMNHEPVLPIKILYKTPHTLGADRVAGSTEAAAMFPGAPVLKIDFGTCITFDLITATGEYLGGSISPGMMMRFKAMNSFTARLPLVDPMQYSSFELTGTDTATAMVSGVMWGIKYEIEGIINSYRERYKGLKVVATGGDFGLFATMIESEIFARPYLVLEGLNRILNLNFKR